MNEDLKLRPFFTAKDNELIEQFVTRLSGAKEKFGWIYKAKLSGFIDPKRLPAGADEATVYKTSVDLVIFETRSQDEQSQREAEFLRPLVAYDLPSNWTSAKSSALATVGLSYERLKAEMALDPAEFRSLASKQHPCVGITRQSTEACVGAMMQEACFLSSGVYLSEMAASELFFATFSSSLESSADRNYLSRTTFDGVVATLPPYSLPLILVEVDGSIHDKPKKRAKDEQKDLIVRSSGVPLLRVDVREGVQHLQELEPFLGHVFSAMIKHARDSTDFMSHWAAYLDSELAKLSDVVLSQDLKYLANKALSELQGEKERVARLSEPDSLAVLKATEYDDRLEFEARVKAKSEQRSKACLYENIRQEVFSDLHDRPIYELGLYEREVSYSRSGFGYSASGLFTLRPRFRGLGFNECFEFGLDRIPLRVTANSGFLDAFENILEHALAGYFFGQFAVALEEDFGKRQKRIASTLARKIRNASD